MTAHDRVAALAAATDWHKSSYSGGQNGGCVEVGTAGHFVGVRDTVLGNQSPVLIFTSTAWETFVRYLRMTSEYGTRTDSTTSSRPIPLRHAHEQSGPTLPTVDASVSRLAKPGSDLDPTELLWQRPGEQSACSSDFVETAPLPGGGTALRNAYNGPNGPVLHFTKQEWDAFLLGAYNREFDTAGMLV